MRSELLRSVAVAILTVQFVLFGTAAAVNGAGRAALEVLKDANRAMLEQDSWRMSQTAKLEETGKDPMFLSSVSDIKVDQIVSARAEAPGQFDSYARHVEVRNREVDGQATFTIEVSNVGVDPDAVDDQWFRVSSVTPTELAAGIGIPEGEWGRVGLVGPDFRDAVLSLVEFNNVASDFKGSDLDPYALDTAEEREGETIAGVETRVFFTKLTVTVGGLMVPVVGIDTVGPLEVIEEYVTWIDADSLVFVKQEEASVVKMEKLTKALNGTSLFFDYNMPLQVPDPTTTLDEAADAIIG